MCCWADRSFLGLSDIEALSPGVARPKSQDGLNAAAAVSSGRPRSSRTLRSVRPARTCAAQYSLDRAFKPWPCLGSSWTQSDAFDATRFGLSVARPVLGRTRAASAWVCVLSRARRALCSTQPPCRSSCLLLSPKLLLLRRRLARPRQRPPLPRPPTSARPPSSTSLPSLALPCPSCPLTCSPPPHPPHPPQPRTLPSARPPRASPPGRPPSSSAPWSS